MEQPQPGIYYTIPEVCRALRVSRATLYHYLGRELAVTRIGKCVRIAQEDLEAFQRAQRESGEGAA